jgi:hypothetical protein
MDYGSTKKNKQLYFNQEKVQIARVSVGITVRHRGDWE